MREGGDKKENVTQVAFTAINRHEETIALSSKIKGRGKIMITCSYCKKAGHHKDKCWSLHGHPGNHRRNNRSAINNWDQKVSDGCNINPKVSKIINDSSLADLVKLLNQVAKTNLVINTEANEKSNFAFIVLESKICS